MQFDYRFFLIRLDTFTIVLESYIGRYYIVCGFCVSNMKRKILDVILLVTMFSLVLAPFQVGQNASLHGNYRCFFFLLVEIEHRHSA